MKNKLKLTPIDIHPAAVWYYENIGSIEVIVCPAQLGIDDNNNCVSFRIPMKKLRETLQRVNAENRRRKKRSKP